MVIEIVDFTIEMADLSSSPCGCLPESAPVPAPGQVASQEHLPGNPSEDLARLEHVGAWEGASGLELGVSICALHGDLGLMVLGCFGVVGFLAR